MWAKVSYKRKHETWLRKINEKIETLRRHSKPHVRTTDKCALITCNSALPYCNKIVEFLFKFHLCQTTLHYHVLSQLRQVILFTHQLGEFYNMNDNIVVNSLDSMPIINPFETKHSKQSCNLILHQLSEDSPITKEIANAIHVIFDDYAIQHTINISKIAQAQIRNTKKHKLNQEKTDTNCNININCNFNFNYDDRLIEYAESKFKSNDYWIDIPFCEYYFENIMQYVGIADSRYFNTTPLIFDYNTMKDYKLLRNHVTSINGCKTSLCDSTSNNSHIYFILGSEVCITIFNIEEKIQLESKLTKKINLSLGWYKKVLIHFDGLFFCLPLSWFEMIRTRRKSKKTKVSNVDDIKVDAPLLHDLALLHRSIVEYENKRFEIENEKNSKRHIARKALYERYGNGVTIPYHLQDTSFDQGPQITIWIIPDIKNLNCSTYTDYNALFESKLIENLLNWKQTYAQYMTKLKKRTGQKNDNELITSIGIYNFDSRIEYFNVHFKDLINYTYITPEIWQLIRNDGQDEAALNFEKCKKNLIRRVDALVGNVFAGGQASEALSIDEYLKTSNEKYEINSIYRQCNQYFFHWCRDFNNRMEPDLRLEYFRIYLNYPTLYKYKCKLKRQIIMDNYNHNIKNNKQDNVGASSNCKDDCKDTILNEINFENIDIFFSDAVAGTWARHSVVNQITTMINEPSIRHGIKNAYATLTAHNELTRYMWHKMMRVFNVYEIDHFHPNGEYVYDPSTARLKYIFNFEYCDQIERLFEYSENLIDTIFDSIDNTHIGKGAGVTIERVLSFGFKQRLINILKSKNLFEGVVDEKCKSSMSYGTMVTNLDLNDQFSFENYIRLAFSDWNCSIIALFIKSNVPFTTKQQRDRLAS